MSIKSVLSKSKKENGTLAICRVSDLLSQHGFNKELLVKEFAALSQEIWGNICNGDYVWTEDMLRSHFQICPDCVLCAFENGKLVATVTFMITNDQSVKNDKTWLAKTANGYLTNHLSNGDIMFGVDLSVSRRASPRVSDKLVQTAIFFGLFGKGLRYLFLGSRIPSYHKKSYIPIEQYVHGKTSTGRPLDPQLGFYTRNGFEIMEILPEYMEDPDSFNYGVLVKMDNPFYKFTKALPFLKPIVRFVGKLLFVQIP